MSCFFMIRTENNKTNLLESLSSYPSIIGDIGVKNDLESLPLSRTIIHSICKRSGIKEWQCQILTHNITSNNKSILALDDEFDIVTLITLSAKIRIQSICFYRSICSIRIFEFQL